MAPLPLRARTNRTLQAGAQRHLRVVPLFETKADLEEAGKTIKALLDIDWYHKVQTSTVKACAGRAKSTWVVTTSIGRGSALHG